jgi:hypothetical protein
MARINAWWWSEGGIVTAKVHIGRPQVREVLFGGCLRMLTSLSSLFSLSLFSFERRLYAQLVRNPVLNASNAAVVIETMRNIAEHVLWGDKHDPLFFEYFLEKNILSFMLSIGAPPDVDAQVKIQLIQTLSMMIENMRTPSSLYFMLSNNRINDLISHHEFDFARDEDLLAHYVSFLKTLALKLDPNTVQFFFNAREQCFPLLTEAAAYHAHRETMVQTAVRNLVLQVLSVKDDAVQRYLCERFVPVFSVALAVSLCDLCQRYATALAFAATAVSPGDAKGRSQRKTVSPSLLRDSIDDELLYMNDAMRSVSAPLAHVWARALFTNWIAPQLLWCTFVPVLRTTEKSNGTNDDDDDDSDDDSDDDDDDDDDDDSSDDDRAKGKSAAVSASIAPVSDIASPIAAAVSWSLLARLFSHLTYEPLATVVARRLLAQCDNAAFVRRCFDACADAKARAVPLRQQFGVAPRRRTRTANDNATEEARAAQSPATEPLPIVAIDDQAERDMDASDGAAAPVDNTLQTLAHGGEVTILGCLCTLLAVATNTALDSSLVAQVLCETRLAAVAALLCAHDQRRSPDVRCAASAVLRAVGARLLPASDAKVVAPPHQLAAAEAAFATVGERVRGHLASPWREVVEPAFVAAVKRAKPEFRLLDCLDQMANGTAGLLMPVDAPPSMPERAGDNEARSVPPLPPLRWAAMVCDFEQAAALMALLDKQIDSPHQQ